MDLLADFWSIGGLIVTVVVVGTWLFVRWRD